MSNLFNIYRFRPVPWFYLDVESQLPIVAEGFTEFNTGLNFMPTRSLSFRIGHRYIDGNEFFADNSQIDFYAYLRINDQWGLSIYEQYEYFRRSFNISATWSTAISRAGWLPFGAQVRDNQGGDTDLGVLLVLTLKNAPQVTLPVQFDQATSPIEPGANGN